MLDNIWPKKENTKVQLKQRSLKERKERKNYFNCYYCNYSSLFLNRVMLNISTLLNYSNVVTVLFLKFF